MPEPVFYDPRRARWKRLRRLIDVVAIVVSALGAAEAELDAEAEAAVSTLLGSLAAALSSPPQATKPLTANARLAMMMLRFMMFVPLL